jgi:UPF0716 protein FxsA
MGYLILLIFVIIAIEIAGVWLVGELLDSLPMAIWLAILTSFIGLGLLSRARERMQPAAMNLALARGGRGVADLVFPLIGAVLLVIPGFVTDLLGLICLIPPLRAPLLVGGGRLLSGIVQRNFGSRFRWMHSEDLSRGSPPPRPNPPPPFDRPPRGPIKEADFEIID